MHRYHLIGIILLAIGGCGGTDSSVGSSDPEALDTPPPRGNAALRSTQPVPTNAPEVDSDSGRRSSTFMASESGVATAPRPVSSPPKRRELPRGLSPAQLTDFLARTDDDLRMIATGRAGFETQQETLDELQRIVVLKKQAAKRLIDHESADDRQIVLGQRGLLQSLSQLASLGDLEAAEELETLANGWKRAADPSLNADSRLVLVGFAIERLRHGKPEAANQIVAEIRDLVEQPGSADVAAMMVMGQSRDALQQYGHEDEARLIEQMIAEEFIGSDDEVIARMARQIVAASQGIESDLSPAMSRAYELRERMIVESEGTQNTDILTVKDWNEMIDALIRQDTDLVTAEYLARVSLDAEALGRRDLAAATYAAMDQHFPSFDDQARLQLRTALDARENRQSIIGQSFAFDLPSVSGEPLDMESFRGRVVLMPFWSSQFPESLDWLDQLRAIQSQFPGRVEIVGVNLDTAERDPAVFMKSAGLTFRSFRSVTTPSAAIANPVAFEFGAVTLNFVAVLDPQGRVAAVNFSGVGLSDEVARLLP